MHILISLSRAHTRLRIATRLDTKLSSKPCISSTNTNCWSVKMAEAEGKTKDKDGGKKKKGFLKTPKIFHAPATPVRVDSGTVVQYHHSPTSNQPSSPGSPPLSLGKENHFPPELLKVPWRKMEQEGPWGDEVSVSLNNLHSCKFPQTHAELKAEIQTHRIVSNAGIKNINILLVGEISSGKSSFFNTVESGFAGYVTTRADTGIDTTSITKKVTALLQA